MLMLKLLDGSVRTMKKTIVALAVASKENGLEVNLIKLNTWPCLEIRIQDEVTV